MAEVITRRNLILLEDDAFALTRTEVSTPIAALVPENTIFFAGVRVFGAEKFMVDGSTPPAAVRISLSDRNPRKVSVGA
ncbi:MAG: hypothetical protein V1844_17230 [Pseudomonadota bacterium]